MAMEKSGQSKEMIDAEAMIQESEPSMGILEEKAMTKGYVSPASPKVPHFIDQIEEENDNMTTEKTKLKQSKSETTPATLN